VAGKLWLLYPPPHHPWSLMTWHVAGKLWLLYPPQTVPSEPTYSQIMLTPPLQWLDDLPSMPPSDRPITCLQRAGEALWLPDFWMHATLNLGESIAVGAQISLHSARSQAVHTALLATAPASSFALTLLASNHEPRSERHTILSAYAHAIDASPLHTNALFAALAAVGRMEHSTAVAHRASSWLQSHTAALERAVTNARVEKVPAARAIAILVCGLCSGTSGGSIDGGMISDGVMSDGISSDGLIDSTSVARKVHTRPTDELGASARRALLRALELNPQEELARAVLSKLGESSQAKLDGESSQVNRGEAALHSSQVNRGAESRRSLGRSMAASVGRRSRRREGLREGLRDELRDEL